MSLFAYVHCNCFENGTLNEPPPERVTVSMEGAIEPRDATLDRMLRFDRWRIERACRHKEMMLAQYELGCNAAVRAIRAELARYDDAFEYLLEHVLTSDWRRLKPIPPLEVVDGRLREEVALLQHIRPARAEIGPLLHCFGDHMQRLIDAALSTGKPIVIV